MLCGLRYAHAEQIIRTSPCFVYGSERSLGLPASLRRIPPRPSRTSTTRVGKIDTAPLRGSRRLHRPISASASSTFSHSPTSASSIFHASSVFVDTASSTPTSASLLLLSAFSNPTIAFLLFPSRQFASAVQIDGAPVRLNGRFEVLRYGDSVTCSLAKSLRMRNIVCRVCEK